MEKSFKVFPFFHFCQFFQFLPEGLGPTRGKSKPTVRAYGPTRGKSNRAQWDWDGVRRQDECGLRKRSVRARDQPAASLNSSLGLGANPRQA